jgi:hypothetical protein
VPLGVEKSLARTKKNKVKLSFKIKVKLELGSSFLAPFKLLLTLKEVQKEPKKEPS